MAKTVTWRPSDYMAAWLRERAELAQVDVGLSSRTRIELTMWRKALAYELGRTRWSLPELGLIAEICNKPVTQDRLYPAVGRIARAVIESSNHSPGLYGQKWGVDELAFVGRLALLGPVADAALADAVARWWRIKAEHTVEGWASVGVTVVESLRIYSDDLQAPAPVSPEVWQNLRTQASGVPLEVLMQSAGEPADEDETATAEHDTASTDLSDDAETWPPYHTTASCYRSQDVLWWVQVQTRWTNSEIVAKLLPVPAELTPQAADAALAKIGWTRQGPWTADDPDHYRCDVFAKTSAAFASDYQRQVLEDELLLLDRNAYRLRRQLAILNTMKRPGDAPTTDTGGGQGDE